MMHVPTYKGDGVQGGDFSVESESFSNPSHFLGDILGVASFGTIDDQGASRLLHRSHGRKELLGVMLVLVFVRVPAPVLPSCAQKG